MLIIKNKTDSDTWILNDNGADIWRLAPLCPNCLCTTGQPNQREFKTEAEALAEIPKQYRDL